jgi:hypothetical protein
VKGGSFEEFCGRAPSGPIEFRGRDPGDPEARRRPPASPFGRASQRGEVGWIFFSVSFFKIFFLNLFALKVIEKSFVQKNFCVF